MGYSSTSSTGESGAEVGEVRQFRFTPSSKWLPYEGGMFNYNDYPVLGALYGASMGGTFTLEDFRGRAVYAADGSNLAGSLVGSNTEDLSHTHGAGTLATAIGGAHNHGGSTSVVNEEAAGTLGLNGQATPTHSHTINQESGHTHTVSGATQSSLSSLDKRPARGYLRLYIRAIP